MDHFYSTIMMTLALACPFHCEIRQGRMKRHSDVTLQQDVIFSEHLLLSSTVTSKIRCAQACKDTVNCYTFTYTRVFSGVGGQGLCRVHSARMTSNSSRLITGDTTVYEIEDIDDCSSTPCQNGGLCTDGIDDYSCACVAGFTGNDCQTDIDDCSPTPCQNGGLCTDGIDDYSCACVAGFTGNDCQTDIDECSSNPCLNGASCTDGLAYYLCTCAAGFTGSECETDIDDCSASPCQNGGSCTDGVNSYSCTCATGFTGNHCETATWLQTPCSSNNNCPALNSECFAGECLCTPGYLFSHSQYACVGTCTNLNATYLIYKDRNFDGWDQGSKRFSTQALCKSTCNANSECRTMVYDSSGPHCYFKYVTALKYPGSWTQSSVFDVYQRTCD